MKNSINILDNVFVIQRIVDPKHKKIITLDNDIKIDNDHKCFEFWKTGTACCNCISMRALNENSSFSKLEYVDEKLYMVISAPINVEGDIYIAELIKMLQTIPCFQLIPIKLLASLHLKLIN